jgi:hypothetical protein
MDEGDDVRAHLNGFFDTVDKLAEMDVEINPNLLAIMLLYSSRQKNHATGRTNRIANSLKKNRHELFQTEMENSNFVVRSAVNTVTKQMGLIVRIKRTMRIKTVTIRENMRKRLKMCHFVRISNRLLMVVNINGVFSLLVSEGVIIDSRTNHRSRISLPRIIIIFIINQG